MMRWFLVPLLILSLLRVDITYDKHQPAWILWGNLQNIHWDDARHEWVNENTRYENWRRQLPETTWFGAKWYWEYVRRKLLEPEYVPVKREVIIGLNHDLYCKPDVESSPVFLAVVFMQQEKTKRRFVLINVEQNVDCEEQYRVWPHLGLNVIGTVAYEEGWEVVLHDEFIQGHVDLAEVVQPGDVVGLSLVVSGMERGLELARHAKQLGATYVIAGNDAAIFRAPQLLALPDHPIDAVFTSNSTNAVRQFFREIPHMALQDLCIPEVATSAGQAAQHSNESGVLRLELTRRRDAKASRMDPMDGFVFPKLDLFGPAYWNAIWTAYRSQYGHKHARPEEVRGATIHLAQGCTRTQGKDACTYCTIFGIGDIRIPSEGYLAALIERYQAFGITNFYNVTDSAYEMRPLAERLRKVGFRTPSLILYGRAHGLAHQPELLESWLGLIDDRLMINCGMDSGDERILTEGVFKSSTRGSRLSENHQAILNLRGSGAHLQYSLIFGSPGETHESCERSLEFVQWVTDMLGLQCDVLESDIYWLNFGSAAARVFHDYSYAVQLAAIAGKAISQETWYRDFGQHADAFSVPRSAQEAWYLHFTRITLNEALDYVRRSAAIMDHHPGRVKGRTYAFKRPGES